MLTSLNSFLVFCGRADCKVKLYRVQKKTYLAANRELSKAEYVHESDIIIHKAAKKAFDDLALKKLPAVKGLQAEHQQEK